METSIHIPGHSAAAIAVVALLAAAGLLLYAWRIRGALARRDQAILVTLRLVTVLGVVGAFLQVSVRREELVRRQSIVPVLVDESASMGVIGADGQTGSEQVARFFREQASWLDGIEREHDVRYFAFADGVRRVTREDVESAPLPEGGRTDLLAALRASLKDVPPGDVGGVIVFSDGIDNGALSQIVTAAGSVPPRERPALASLPGPIIGFTPAPDERIRDVALGRIDGLGYLIVRDLAEVRAEVRSAGYDQGLLTVTLSDGGEVVARTQVPVEEAAGGATAVLTWLPREPGRRVLEVVVSPMPGEISLANNSRSLVVDVVRDRLRVLHVAGHPSWDERFLRDYMKRRRDVETVSFHTLRSPDAPVATPDDETTLIPFPADEIFLKQIEGFDLVILQDYDLPEVDRDRYAQGIAKYVLEGGALLVVGGSFSLGSRGPWPARLDPILPVVAPKVAGHGMTEGRFTASVTAAGARHPAAAEPRVRDLMARAPALTAVNPVTAVETGATILVGAAPEGPPGAPRVPLVVTSPEGRGRVAMVLTDTLWRWSFDPVFDELYRRVMDGLFGYLTRDPAASPLRVRAAHPQLAPRAEQELSLTAADGVTALQVRVQRRTQAGAWEDVGPAVDLAPSDAGGPVSDRFVTGEPGVFHVVASGLEGEARLEATDAFVVGPSPEEVAQVVPTTRYLGVLAESTGGRVESLAAPDLKAVGLRSEVVARVGLQADEPLWNHPAVFLLLLLALALEWYAERKIGYT